MATYLLETEDAPKPELDPTELPYGSDIAFNQFTYSVNGAGKYITLTEKDAIKQAIYLALLTRPGDYAVKPQYGVGVQSYLKKRYTTAVIDELKTKIKTQLEQDPRIDEVTGITISRETVNGSVVHKIFIRVKAAGEDITFEPFVFVGG